MHHAEHILYGMNSSRVDIRSIEILSMANATNVSVLLVVVCSPFSGCGGLRRRTWRLGEIRSLWRLIIVVAVRKTTVDRLVSARRLMVHARRLW